MGGIQNRIYTDEQRDAVARAYIDRGIRPAQKLVNLARAGELEQGLAPFEVTGGVNTVRDMIRKEKKKRAGLAVSTIAERPTADAVTILQKRLLSAADHHLTTFERRGKAAKTDQDRLASLQGLTAVVKLIREAAALSGIAEPLKKGRTALKDEAPQGSTQGPSILRSHNQARANGDQPTPAQGSSLQEGETTEALARAGRDSALEQAREWHTRSEIHTSQGAPWSDEQPAFPSNMALES